MRMLWVGVYFFVCVRACAYARVCVTGIDVADQQMHSCRSNFVIIKCIRFLLKNDDLVIANSLAKFISLIWTRIMVK